MSEPNKATLYAWLQTALEVELSTIPPYLVALLSIRLPKNREASELIRSVMVEEMLHLALVANVMNAVGATPRLDRAAIPTYPLQMTFEGVAFQDRRFPIDLAPFSAATINTFLQIELPRQPAVDAHLLELKIAVPAPTIGEFYSRIVDLLATLEAAAPGTLFTGEPANQILKDFYWAGGGVLVAVHDLATAREALSLVISQGEGAWPSADGKAANFGKPLAMGHYYRFNEIAHARRYLASDDPTAPPTGGAIDIDYAATYPIKVSPTSADYPAGSKLDALNDAFNRRYTAMLLQLNEAMNGTPKSLYTAIMDSMHELTPLAHEMMKLPIEGDASGLVGCPTFEWVED